MRLLLLTAFYPPVRSGGYDQLCHDVAVGLQARGHELSVLTSSYQREQAPPSESNVHRLLHLQSDPFYYKATDFFLARRRHERQNMEALARMVDKVSPDVIAVWSMWALSRALPAFAEKLLPSRVVYYLADYWPIADDPHRAFWSQPGRQWLTRVPRYTLGRLALSLLARERKPVAGFRNVLCVSAALRQRLIEAGLPIAHARVIHNGVDVTAFSEHSGQESRWTGSGELRLLYAGQLVRHKGVHTAIEAVAQLAQAPSMVPIRLTVLGAGHPDYERSLRAMVDQYQLHDRVVFRRSVPRVDMPGVLRDHDVLLFPSTYDEPLARMVQEAMLGGLVVVGTTTGGTGEILVHGENGLTFPTEDAAELASQVSRLAADPRLFSRLAEAGQRTVKAHFTMDRMVDELEEYLEGVVRGSDGCV